MQTSHEFPEDPPAPDRRWFRPSDLIALVLLIVFLSALAPSICPPGKVIRARHIECAHNLSQLYKLIGVYAASHRDKWPQADGEGLWLLLQTCKPPLIDPTMTEILFCPVRGEDSVAGATDYRGPSGPVSKLQPGDPLGADKPANHGDKHGGNVLRMDGCVLELACDDPEWMRCDELLKP